MAPSPGICLSGSPTTPSSSAYSTRCFSFSASVSRWSLPAPSEMPGIPDTTRNTRPHAGFFPGSFRQAEGASCLLRGLPPKAVRIHIGVFGRQKQSFFTFFAGFPGVRHPGGLLFVANCFSLHLSLPQKALLSGVPKRRHSGRTTFSVFPFGSLPENWRIRTEQEIR